MTKSEAGKLGNKALVVNNAIRRELTVANYNKNPKTCIHCQSPLSYENRNNKFCNHSCSASHNNSNRVRISKHEKNCLMCGTITRNPRYCKQDCQVKHNYQINVLPRILAGQVSERPTLKKYLIMVHGHKCQGCNLTDWNNKPIPLELHHVDNNAGNNFLDNLQILCPNCHAMTPNAKGGNKGYGRKSRGLSRS